MNNKNITWCKPTKLSMYVHIAHVRMHRRIVICNILNILCIYTYICTAVCIHAQPTRHADIQLKRLFKRIGGKQKRWIWSYLNLFSLKWRILDLGPFINRSPRQDLPPKRVCMFSANSGAKLCDLWFGTKSRYTVLFQYSLYGKGPSVEQAASAETAFAVRIVCTIVFPIYDGSRSI